MGITVTLDRRGLDRLLATLEPNAERLVVKVAHNVLATAQQNAPVRTGYLRNSGHVEPGEDRFSRYVVFSANYSIYVHEGTRYMMGRPFLRQSVESHRGSFQDDLSTLFGSLVER